MTNWAVLEKRLGYTFKNKKLLVQALTHRSMRSEHNERLEFLGDSILNFVIAHALYQKIPKAKEGDLSRYRSQLVCEDSLATYALSIELGDFLILGAGELRAGGFRRKSIMADALEAVIAAIYLDADLLTAQRLVESWFNNRIETISSQKVVKDPKSRLQEYLQAKKHKLPQYEVLTTIGVDHNQVFHVRCEVEGFDEISEGKGESRKVAEQIAAATFLKDILKVGS